MANLENVQGANNSQDVNLAGISPSNDLLQIGADAIARGRSAGFTDEETLDVYARRKQLAVTKQKGFSPSAQLLQKIKSIRGENPSEVEGVREIPTSSVQFEQDGRERDQSVEDAYYGRDDNAFSYYDNRKKRNRNIYLDPRDRTVARVRPNGPSEEDRLIGDVNEKLTERIRLEAENRSYGIRVRNKEFNEQTVTQDKRENGKVVRNRDGTIRQEPVEVVENTYNELSAGQGSGGGGGRAADDAVKRISEKRSGSPASLRAVKKRLKDAGTLQNYSDEQLEALAVKELEERRRRVFGEGPIQSSPEAIRERLLKTADPSTAIAAEAAAVRKLIAKDDANFSTQKRADVIARERAEVNQALTEGITVTDSEGRPRTIFLGSTGDTASIPYISGGLTSAKTDPDVGIAVKALRAESDARFNARPQAVYGTDATREYADFYGFSPYVDERTGASVDLDVVPEQLNTNHAGSDVKINAPQSQTIATTAQWITDNLKSGKTGDVLADTNMNQITADFARRVEAAAPGYVSKAPTSVEEFDALVQRVIQTRQNNGEPFFQPVVDDAGNPVRYTKGKRKGRQKQSVVANPGVADVMTALRLTSGEAGQLANALYTMGLASEGSRPVTSFSDDVTVNTGSMFGEKIDVGTAGRSTTRAAFGRLSGTAIDEETGDVVDISDAQKPQIGGIREYDESGKVTSQEAPITRRVSKGRTPEEAVAVYREQRKKNKQPVDEAYARQIAEENASLRADQDVTNMAIEQRMMDQNPATSTAQPPSKVAEDAAFFRAAQRRNDEVGRMDEATERLKLVDLIQKGAQFGSDSGFGRNSAQDAARGNTFSTGSGDYFEESSGKWSMSGRDAGEVSAGRKLDVPTYRDKRLTATTTPEYKDGYSRTETPGRAADLTGIRTVTGATPSEAGRVTAANTKFDSLHPAAGGNGVKPPTTNVSAAGAPMPDDMRRELIGLPGPANEALNRGIAARVLAGRRDRLNRALIGAGIGAAGAGLGIGLSAINNAYNGPREEQY